MRKPTTTTLHDISLGSKLQDGVLTASGCIAFDVDLLQIKQRNIKQRKFSCVVFSSILEPLWYICLRCRVIIASGLLDADAVLYDFNQRLTPRNVATFIRTGRFRQFICSPVKLRGCADPHYNSMVCRDISAGDPGKTLKEMELLVDCQ